MNLLAKTHDLHKPEFTIRARSDDPITSILAGRKADKFAASHAGLVQVLDEIRHGCQVWRAL